VRADVTQAAELLRALARRSRPLRGVIHAAGVLADTPISQLDWPRFEAVLSPKVEGLYHLHAATFDQPLDFFVIFSSAIGLLGNAGQANHAAASAMAEGFAWYRRSQGLPALAIDWGAWQDAGAAVRRQKEGRWNLSGVRGITPQRGRELLRAFLAGDEAHAVVLDVDWSVFRTRLPQAPPHLREVFGAAPELRTEPASPAGSDLGEYLQHEVARLIGFPAGQVELDAGLNELGIDSLMAVRLRNRLKADWNLEAPIIELMQNPSIRTLVGKLDRNGNAAVVEGVI
jgi:aryl carrier-like protein